MTSFERLALLWFCTSVYTAAQAQVTLDGSLGSKGQIPLQQNTYVIDSQVGKLAGSNLFHSFGRFDLETGTTAQFTDSTQSAITRIIGRITGGEPSSIDGTLQSTIPHADLYLINPAGMIFGPNAKLDLPGAFYVSTASGVKFADGKEFAASDTQIPLLSSSAPVAFGFLEQAGDIQMQGSQLSVNNGLYLSAGSMTFDTAKISTTGGDIHLDAVAKQALTLPTQGGSASLQGNITLANSLILSEAKQLSAGDIVLHGGTMTLNNSLIRAWTQTSIPGGNIKIDSKALNMSGSWLDTASYGAAPSGDIGIKASDIALDFGWITANTSGSGNGGQIDLQADTLTGSNGANVYAATIGAGNNGNISLQATKSIEFQGQNGSYASGVFNQSASTASGGAGDISISSPSISWGDGAKIEVSTSGSGQGGNLKLFANDLNLTGATVANETYGSANAGNLNIKTGTLALNDGATISGTTYADGRGSDIDIQATRAIALQGHKTVENRDYPSNIMSIPSGNGKGQSGNIFIATPWLQLASSTYIELSSMGGNRSGNADIRADNILVQGGYIASNAYGTGPGGSLTIHSKVLSMTEGGEIMIVASDSGDAGSLNLFADTALMIGGQKDISGSQAVSGIYGNNFGEGVGANITLKTASLSVYDNGTIFAQTTGKGFGGTINVYADNMSMNHADILTTASSSGKAGDISLNINDTLSVTAESNLSARTNAPGDGGAITINAKNLQLDGNSLIDAVSYQDASGNGGNMSFRADTMSLLNGALISNASLGQGAAGNINLQINHLNIAGKNSDGEPSAISSASVSSGDAGTITLSGEEAGFRAQLIELQDGRISSFTAGQGKGGEVNIHAEHLMLDAGEIKTGSKAGSSGKAGSIELDVSALSAKHRSVISSEMMGENNAWQNPNDDSAGSIHGKIDDLQLDASSLSVRNSSKTSSGGGEIELLLGNARLSHGSAITSETLGHAKGGDILINTALAPARQLSLSGHSLISASATGEADGNAGNINIFANTLTLDGASNIASASTSRSDAGTIAINDAQHPGDTLSITDNSQITVASSEGNAGNIDLFAERWLYLRNAQITTSAAAGLGNGGSILSRSQFLIMNDSRIKADALKGNGGNIDIVSDYTLISPNSTITAASQFGLQGKVSIQSQYSNIAGSIGVLPGQLLDVTNRLNDDCAAATSNASSFTLGGRGQLPLNPEFESSSLPCGSIF